MTNDMTKGNPLKIFIYFTIPLLIGNIFQQLYSMVDTIIVGRFVGVNALAALGACNSLFFLVNGLVLGLTSGFAVLVAQKFGAKDEKGHSLPAFPEFPQYPLRETIQNRHLGLLHSAFQGYR